MEWPYLHHAQFTTKGHSLIIVYKYDIYYRLGPRTYQSFRVTDDAIPGVIYNGIPDWLYEGMFCALTLLLLLLYVYEVRSTQLC